MTNALVHRVPDNLKRLIRYVLKSFYSFELYLVMESLIMYPCIKEEDLASVLKLEPKHVRQYLNNLKAEKFVSEKSTMETTTTTTSTASATTSSYSNLYDKQRQESMQKKSYFYINYKMMVNVIKYKLDKIRIQIETEEKQCTSRASFKCTQCRRAYSDLEIFEIYNTMQCIYCGGHVEEDAANAGNRSARNLLAKFNTQMELVYRLLHEVESVKLAPEVLSPQPHDYSDVIARLNEHSSAEVAMGAGSGSGANVKGGEKWSGEATRRVDYGQTQINVNVDSVEASGTGSGQLSSEISSLVSESASPEPASSLMESLELCSKSNNTFSSIIQFKAPAAVSEGSGGGAKMARNGTQAQLAAQGGSNTDSKGDLILKTLLIHENKQSGAGVGSGGSVTATSHHLKKRDSNHLEYENGAAVAIGYDAKLDQVDAVAVVPSKKRRLNGYYSEMDIENQLMDTASHLAAQAPKHNHHRGSMAFHSYDNSMDVDDNEYEYEMGGTGGGGMRADGDEDDDYLVRIDNQVVTIDKVTPHLILKMNKQEKEAYIDKCRQLYMAMYEL